MNVKTTTLHCYHCAGAIEVPRDTMRTTCPYCREEVWAPMSVRDMGEASRRLVQILQREFAGEMRSVEQALTTAMMAGDEAAYRQALTQQAELHAAAFDRIDYWRVFGVQREGFVAQRVEQSMATFESMAAEMRALRGGDTAAAAEIKAGYAHTNSLWRSYTEALERKDLEGFARAWREFMTHALTKNPSGLTEEEMEHQILGSMENMLRDQGWVGPEELERLGFESVYDAERDDSGALTVGCQNCGAVLEAAEGDEFVDCPYCEATTHLQMTLTQMQEAAREWATPDYLQLARDAVASAYPDLDLHSPACRVLIFCFAEQMAGELSAELDRRYRDELGLGEGRSPCGTCNTAFATVTPAVVTCPMCQQPM